MKAIRSLFIAALLLPFFALPLRAEASMAEYEVYFHRIPAVTAEHIKKGDTVVDGAGKGAAGVVARVTVLPCFTEVYRPESGALVCVAEEGYRDITVTVRATAKRTKAGLQAGTLPLLCGKTVFLHLPSLCGEGVILSVTAP